jgi:hypothetical protein
MNKMIIPNGEDTYMSEEIFNQCPEYFVKMVVGCFATARILRGQSDRLESIFGRECIINIIKKDKPTWQDYLNLVEWTI